MQFFVKGYDILVKNKIYANLMVSLEVNMFKKVSLLCLMVLMVSCARQTSDQISQQSAGDDPAQSTTSSAYSALWQNYGSDVGNTNVVEGRLPSQSASLSEAVTEDGFSVFSSPVIFQDSSTNVQSVVALWAKPGQLKVVRYTIESSELTQDSGFTEITLNADSNSNDHQAHQIALSIENDQPFIFVGHKEGVSKYNALTGAHVQTFSKASLGSVYRLLVSEDSLYIQSSSELVKLTAVNMEVNFTKALTSSTPPTRQLPLVISGDHLYVVHGTNVIKVNTTNLEEVHTETVSGRVAGLVAFNDTVIYSDVTTDEFDYSDQSRRVLHTDMKLFGLDFDATYNDYITQRSKAYAGGEKTLRSIGDASFTAIAVTTRALYLPGFSFEFFTDANDDIQSGVVWVHQSTKEIQSVYGNNQQQVYGPVENFLSEGSIDGFGTHYVSRFVIVDSSNANVMSVMNVNEYFFQLSDSWGNTIQHSSAPTKLSQEGTTFDFGFFVDQDKKDKLNHYNSRIMLGNRSLRTDLGDLAFEDEKTAIQAVSVGNRAVVLAGSDNKLYLLVE
tara:strand:+ start:878 stop:2551 length:1674 start_codon:yes stop_codon:yes gene_type:complete